MTRDGATIGFELDVGRRGRREAAPAIVATVLTPINLDSLFVTRSSLSSRSLVEPGCTSVDGDVVVVPGFGIESPWRWLGPKTCVATAQQ